MLIRDAALENGTIADVRVADTTIKAIGHLEPLPHEAVIDARGGLLLPGLHDHHMHLAALAASLASVRCGPPEILDSASFAAALRTPGSGWLRATGYHESVAGMLDAAALDRIVGDRPVRVQHRSGRMWFFNSVALEQLLATHAAPAGLERAGDHFTGRLFDEDIWLQQVLRSAPPSFAQAGALLARAGVTGLTDMSPANDSRIARCFATQTATRSLPQRVLLGGSLHLTNSDMADRMRLGPAKLHLHEAKLPALETAIAFVCSAHERGRHVAVHCTTEVELVYALAAFGAAGTMKGDRLEHASVAHDSAVAEIARLGLAVVTQPHFVRERGDAYLRDVDEDARACLYRLRAFVEADIPLAGGSDAPFGGCNPWAGMAAAVSRRTQQGGAVGISEALTPEEALDIYLRVPDTLHERRVVAVGMTADLCLLDQSWSEARRDLGSVRMRATFIDGRQVFDRVDQAPL